MSTGFKSFVEFWPFYVCEHSRPETRIFHFIGILTIVPLLICAIFFNLYLLLLVPISAYGFAWYSHFFVEKNKPATFTYPLWSLLGDFLMFWLMCQGKMDNEMKRCKEIRNRI
jgi:hypothetical protein